MGKSWGERVEEVAKDPVKVKRYFNLVWLVAYSMLILGFIIILWILFQDL